MSKLDKSIGKFQRRLNLKPRTGYLGDGSGEVRDRANPGKYFVRFLQADGTYSQAVPLPAIANANLPVKEGTPVDVGYDANGKSIILGVNLIAQSATGDNPLHTNPLDDQSDDFVPQDKITTFYAARHADSDNFPFYASVFPGLYFDDSGNLQIFVGDLIDLSGFLPSSGEHCYAVVLLKTDGTLEAFASTPIDSGDTLSFTDIQEAVASGSSGSETIRAWQLDGDDTLLTVEETKIVDLRLFVGGGSGGGTSLDELSDVDLTGVARGDMLVRNSTEWVNVNVSDESIVARIGGGDIAPITVAASRIVGRAAAGSIDDLTGAQVKTILAIDHGADLAGLSDDDHTQYALLAGRATGQTLIGGTAASENLTLDSTGHVTKGKVLIGGSTLRVDEALTTVGIGQAANANHKLAITHNPTDPAANQRGISITAQVNVTANSSLSHSGTVSNIFLNVSSGVTLSSENVGFLAQSGLAAANAGTVAQISGVAARPLINSGAGGAVTSLFPVAVGLTIGGANTVAITTLNGIHINIPSSLNGGSATTVRGINIEDVTVGGTTNQAIRTNAGSVLLNAGGDANTNFSWESDTVGQGIYGVASTERFGVGINAPTTKEHILLTDATTNAVVNVVTIGHRSTGTVAAGLGSAIIFELESTTTNDQSAGRLSYEWVVATHASRTARSKWTVYDTAEREAIRIEASGSAAMIGLWGHAAAVQPAAYTVTNPNALRTIDITGGTLGDLMRFAGAMATDLQSYGAVG